MRYIGEKRREDRKNMGITHLSSFKFGKPLEMGILAHCSSFMNLRDL